MAKAPSTTAEILSSAQDALVVVQTDLKPLTLFDLCDHSTVVDSRRTKNSCHAQARYRVVFLTGQDLLLCGNHHRVERAAMVKAGATILGEAPKCGCGKAECN
jgi:hypothetical protein